MAELSGSDLRDKLIEALEAKAPEHGVDIVDVEIVGTSKAPTVRVRIDRAEAGEGSISLDEVSAQTAWISDLVDELDPIEGTFTLEVSSPGLARPLRKRSDFERFSGAIVRLTTTATEGRRKFTGELVGLEGEDVVLVCDGERIAIPFDTVRTCKIKPSFD